MQLDPIILALYIATVLYAGLGLFALRKRPAVAVMPLAWLMLSLAFWAFCYAFEIALPELTAKVFWAKIEYFGIVSSPVFWLAFTLEYTGRKELLTQRNWTYLFIVPIVTLFLVWTNEIHRLYWSDAVIVTYENYRLLDLSYGPFFWPYIFYSYILMMLGSVLMVLEIFRSPGLYRRQAILLLLAIFSPWMGNIIYLTGIFPIPALDLTPFAFIITGLILAWAATRFRLLDIVPLAHSIILDHLREGIVVIDHRQRVLYLNPLLERLLGYSLTDAVGQPFIKICPRRGDMILSYLKKNTDNFELEMEENGKEIIFDAHISPLYPSPRHRKKEIPYYLLILHDITARKNVEDALYQQQRALKHLHQIVISALQTLDLQSMAQTLVDQLGDLINADGCFLTLWDEGSKEPVPLAAYGPFRESYRSIKPGLRKEKNLTASVLDAGHTLVIDDALNSPYISPNISNLFPTRSALALPLIVGKKRLGAIIIGFNQYHQFKPEEIIISEQAASLIALALEKFQAMDEAQKRAEESERLREAGAIVAETLQADEAVNRILEQLSKVVPHDSASVQLLRDNQLEVVGGHGWGGEEPVIGLCFPIPGENPNTVVIQTGKPYLLNETSDLYPIFKQHAHSERIRSWLGIPMIVHGKIIGLLAIDSFQANYFTESDVKLAVAFADQVAITLENARLFEEAQSLAITDALTGLYNRRGLFELGKIEFARSLRLKRNFSLVMLDIDHFKQVNDTYGHPVGDHVLQKLADLCRMCTRSMDVIGRYGGEEFIILMPESKLADAKNLAERLRGITADSKIETDAGVINITISLGVATYTEHSPSLETLIARADQALFVSKHQGRNRVSVGQ